MSQQLSRYLSNICVPNSATEETIFSAASFRQQRGLFSLHSCTSKGKTAFFLSKHKALLWNWPLRQGSRTRLSVRSDTHARLEICFAAFTRHCCRRRCSSVMQQCWVNLCGEMNRVISAWVERPHAIPGARCHFCSQSLGSIQTCVCWLQLWFCLENMKILQWEKEKLIVCTCLFAVLAAMTDFPLPGWVNSVDGDSTRTLSETESDSENDTSDLSVFDHTFSEWEFRWVWFEFFFFWMYVTCLETVLRLILIFLSLILVCGAAIISQNSQMLKGQNLRHVGFEEKKMIFKN